MRDFVRSRSKALLGNKDRVEVGAAVGLSPDGLVNATDLARELDLENPRVRAQLLALVDQGLLQQGPVEAGKRWYLRQESFFWEACIRFIEQWSEEGRKFSNDDVVSAAGSIDG